MRVVGLYGFGKLYSVGMRIGVPQLAYLACAAAQLLASAGALALSSAVWRGAVRDRALARPLTLDRADAAVNPDPPVREP